MSVTLPIPPPEAIRVEPAPACPLCGRDSELLYEDLRDRIFGAPGAWTMKRCSDECCGMLWLDPRPSPEDIDKAYRTYYTHGTTALGQLGRHDFARRIYSAICEGYWQIRFGYTRIGRQVWHALLAPLACLHPAGVDAISAEVMFLPSLPSGGRLLDIGCGDGRLLQRMHDLGWSAEGVEFDPVCVDLVHSKGLKCALGDLRSQQYPANSFDAIYIGHVIEHVYDPVGFFNECYRVLRSEGKLIALTPNSKSLGHTLYGRDWRGLEPPRHLQLFSPMNLARMATTAGFHVLKSRTTNRGAWYLITTSHYTRHARQTGRDHLDKQARLLSPAGIVFQMLGRLIQLVRPLRCEEILIIAEKRKEGSS